MQAGGGAAVRPGERQRPDRLSRCDPRAHRQGAEHRLVGRADPAPVQHRHGRPPGNHPRVDDHASRDRQDGLTLSPARSTPRCPRPQALAGRSNGRSTAGTGSSGQRLATSRRLPRRDGPPAAQHAGHRRRDRPQLRHGCGRGGSTPVRPGALAAAGCGCTGCTGCTGADGRSGCAVTGTEVGTAARASTTGASNGATDTMGTDLSSSGAGTRAGGVLWTVWAGGPGLCTNGCDPVASEGSARSDGPCSHRVGQCDLRRSGAAWQAGDVGPVWHRGGHGDRSRPAADWRSGPLRRLRQRADPRARRPQRRARLHASATPPSSCGSPSPGLTSPRPGTTSGTATGRSPERVPQPQPPSLPAAPALPPLSPQQRQRLALAASPSQPADRLGQHPVRLAEGEPDQRAARPRGRRRRPTRAPPTTPSAPAAAGRTPAPSSTPSGAASAMTKYVPAARAPRTPRRAGPPTSRSRLRLQRRREARRSTSSGRPSATATAGWNGRPSRRR